MCISFPFPILWQPRGAGLLAKCLGTPIWGALADGGGRDPTKPLAASLLLTCGPSVTGSFGLLMALKVLRSGLNGVSTLVDTTTLRCLGGRGDPGAGYVEQRLWGSVAWGLRSYAVGLIDSRGFDGIFIWTYGFSAVILVLLIFKPARSPRTGATVGRTVAAAGTVAFGCRGPLQWSGFARLSASRWGREDTSCGRFWR